MFYALLFLVLTCLILTHPAVSLHYAFHGLTLWFNKMIPALLPFMILSGVLVRMGLTERFTAVLDPLLRPLFRVRRNVLYCIFLGFLCGFPMGARVAADLLDRDLITRREAEYLLAFCNNIGPVYFCSFVLPLLGRTLVLPYVAGMYGIPLLYGLFLRRTFFRDLPKEAGGRRGIKFPEGTGSGSLLAQLDSSIQAALGSISMLCGYMILFNLLCILPHCLLPKARDYLAPLLEITGGLSLLGRKAPLYSLLLLPFGGLSCIAQTYSMIRGRGLSLKSYVLHKVILTLLTALYYLGWLLLSPRLFLG